METMILVDGYDRSKNPRRGTYRYMTLAEGKALACGERVVFRSVQGVARTLKVNGQPKTWKRDPNRCEIPAKYGLYEYDRFVWYPSQQAFVSSGGAVVVVAV